MRIISKFHDYYDCIQRQGQDRTCTWLRSLHSYKSGLSLEDLYFDNPTYREKSLFMGMNVSGGPRISFYTVGFCGHLYPVARIDSKWCYSKKEVEQIIKENHPKYYEKYYLSNKKVWWATSTEEKTHSIFSLDKTKNENLFRQFNTPVFITSGGFLVLHGGKNLEDDGYEQTEYCEGCPKTLSDIDFYRRIDTNTAFQEIHMYLSGVLGVGHPHVPEMDNKTKIQQHGFDKFSFRKEAKKA